jgi:4-hydroxybenzoate polyprenyltransferase
MMTRPVNIVIAIITLLVGYTLLQHNPTAPVLVLQMLGFATAIGFANIQNDILDL